MKLTSSLLLLPIIALAPAVSAQGTYIRSPPAGARVRQGRNVVLQLVRPMSHQGSREVGLALSFQYCGNAACPDPVNEVGAVLRIGQYKPVMHEIPGNPYENFTLTLPNFDYQPGKARLIATRFHLIGAGPSASLDTNTVEVNLVR